ncbi:MAG: hypothetical protein IPK65_06630 [Gammaproteobacteria bacterium]|nr:hypothetical protein [Gammaproteobacteria bacterium]
MTVTSSTATGSSAQLTASGETGAHTVVVDVDGTTFRRQHRQDIEVVESPVIADIRTDGERNHPVRDPARRHHRPRNAGGQRHDH